MEDRGIAEIEKAAHDYADARDARMSLSTDEKNRHTKLLAVMAKHGKKAYVHRNGSEVIEVKVTPKDATAKARVKIVSAEEYDKPRRTATAEPEIEGTEPELDIDANGDQNGDEEPDDSEFDDIEGEGEGDDEELQQ